MGKGPAKDENGNEIVPERVLLEWAKIAFFDIRKVVRWGKNPERLGPDGQPIFSDGRTHVEIVPADELTPSQSAAIASIEETNSGLKIKAHDKIAALRDMGRALQMFAAADAAAGIGTGRLRVIVVEDEAPLPDGISLDPDPAKPPADG